MKRLKSILDAPAVAEIVSNVTAGPFAAAEVRSAEREEDEGGVK